MWRRGHKPDVQLLPLHYSCTNRNHSFRFDQFLILTSLHHEYYSSAVVCNNRRFPHTRSFPLFPIFIFDLLCTLFRFVLCAASLDCTVSKHTFTRLRWQGYAADPDRCNFCPIRLPFFRFSYFLPFLLRSFPTLVLFVLLTSFPYASCFLPASCFFFFAVASS